MSVLICLWKNIVLIIGTLKWVNIYSIYIEVGIAYGTITNKSL